MNDLKTVRDALIMARDWIDLHNQHKDDCDVNPNHDVGIALATLTRPSREAELLNVNDAMRILWDAGYKIHGQFGWVTDDRETPFAKGFERPTK